LVYRNRNHLVGTHGDAANAVLAAAGFNFTLLLRWLRSLCVWIAAAVAAMSTAKSRPQAA
jgi:IS5 family transposase